MCNQVCYPCSLSKTFIAQWRDLNERHVRQYQDWTNLDDEFESAKNLLSDCLSMLEYWNSFKLSDSPILEYNLFQVGEFVTRLQKTYNL